MTAARPALAIAFAAFALAAPAAWRQTEPDQPSPPLPPAYQFGPDVVSREVAVFNDLFNPVEITDAVSREVALFNAYLDGQPCEIPVTDAVSREVAVHYRAPCDMNCDGTINGQDIDSFRALLEGRGVPCDICTGDANGDGSINGYDIEPFARCVLNP